MSLAPVVNERCLLFSFYFGGRGGEEARRRGAHVSCIKLILPPPARTQFFNMKKCSLPRPTSLKEVLGFSCRVGMLTHVKAHVGLIHTERHVITCRGPTGGGDCNFK